MTMKTSGLFALVVLVATRLPATSDAGQYTADVGQRAATTGDRMTIEDTVNKTAFLLFLTLASAGFAWASNLIGLLIPAVLRGLVIVLSTGGRARRARGLMKALAAAGMLIIWLVIVYDARAQESGVTEQYLLSFHACESAVCTSPANHSVYLAQSYNGATWKVVPGWMPYTGSVPDIVRRGGTLYIYTPGGVLQRHRLGSGTWEKVKVTLKDSEPGGYIDPSLIVDSQGRLVMFYLLGTGIVGQDPARCPVGETTCLKRFRSATEVSGSDGTQFVAEPGDRLSLTIDANSTGSDPDVFFDGSRYVLYVSRGPAVQVFTSATLHGAYASVPELLDSYLTRSGGVPSGYYDSATERYWTYVHTASGIIRRATHTTLGVELRDADFATVLTATDVGLGSSYRVESPGFAVNIAGVPGAPPVLTAPAAGASLTSFGPMLIWSNPPGTTQYHLQVSPVNNDGPGVDLHAGSSDTSFQIPPPPQWYGLLPDMTYTWRVRVSDAPTFVELNDASWSPWAERTFHTSAVSSGTISAISPPHQSSIATLTPTLQWGNSRTDVFYYEVQLSKDAAFNTDPSTATAMVYSSLLHGGATSPRNSYAVPAGFPLENNTTYYWRVRPRVQGDGTPVEWSSTWSFRTPPPGTVAQTAVYAGPGNVGYPLVTQLAAGVEVSVLGRYGDFVQIQWVEVGTSRQGFVASKLIANQPISLPVFSPQQVPWLHRDLYTATYPLYRKNPTGLWDGGQWPIPVVDSAFRAQQEIRVDVTLSVATLSTSPTDTKTGGIILGNGLFGSAEDRELRFLYQTGGWVVAYQKGDALTGNTTVFSSTVLSRADASGQFSITLKADGRTVAVTLPNGQTAPLVLPESLFGNQVSLALFTRQAPRTELTVSALAIEEAPSGKFVVQPEGPFLKELAQKRGITFGTIGAEAPYGEVVAELAHFPIITREFNLLVPNAGYMDKLLPVDRNTYVFLLNDDVVAFGESHGMRLRGHPLVWGNTLPKWLADGTFSRDDLINIMHEYILTVMGHNRGKIAEWVVVNEAFTNDGKYVDNLWLRGIGPEYVELAFRFAREADPGAVLLYNDYRNEMINAKSDAILSMAKDFKARGVPLDGIGMQMHLHVGASWYPTPTKEAVRANMARYGALGLSVFVSEIDVNTYFLKGTRAEKLARQADIYRDMLSACLESGVCKGFMLWGFSDAHSWLLEPGSPQLGSAESPLIFDENYNPKPAYYALRDTLLAGG